MSMRRLRIAVSTVIALLALGQGVAAGAGPTPWSVVTGSITANVYRNGSTCLPRSTTCVAVGNDYAGVAMIETNASGSWDRVAATPPSPSDEENISTLNGVSCASPTFCVAVGYLDSYFEYYGTYQPLIATYDGQSWTYTILDAGSNWLLHSVSCTSRTHCVAVGGFAKYDSTQIVVETWDGNTWTPTLLAAPPGQTYAEPLLTGVSCTESLCVAVGYYSTDTVRHLQGFAEVFDGSTWHLSLTPTRTGSNALYGVSCLARICTAVGDQDSRSHTLIETFVAGTWTVSSFFRHGSLRSVDCPRVARCAAVGMDYDPDQPSEAYSPPVVLTGRFGTWTDRPVVGLTGSTYNLFGVSCPTPSDCLAVGMEQQQSQGVAGYALYGRIALDAPMSVHRGSDHRGSVHRGSVHRAAAVAKLARTPRESPARTA